MKTLKELKQARAEAKNEQWEKHVAHFEDVLIQVGEVPIPTGSEKVVDHFKKLGLKIKPSQKERKDPEFDQPDPIITFTF